MLDIDLVDDEDDQQPVHTMSPHAVGLEAVRSVRR
jgi:hypothetical protein